MSKTTYLSVYGLVAVLLCWILRAEPFFWDTIQLGARHGDWFYQQGFATLLLPDNMDSGHIPAFGWYLAACWQWFGQSLLVSHLAMTPWVLLVLWQLHRLLKGSLVQTSMWVGMLLLLADPVLAAQLSLMSPDVILTGAFLLAVNSIFERQRAWLACAIMLLGLISLRGMMVGLALFAWQWLSRDRWKEPVSKNSFIETLLPYLPGGLLALAYLSYHYAVKGWIGVHADSPWAASFAGGGGVSMLKQIGIVAWRSLDFGRVFVWIGLALAWSQRGRLLDIRARKTLLLTVILGLVLGLPAVISPGLAQHRYLLPFFVIASYLFWLLLSMVPSLKWKQGLYSLAVLGMLSGHYWVYPQGVAQGWDASLSHKAFFELENNSRSFLAERKIPLTEVGTVFPAVGPIHWRYLNGTPNGFAPLELSTQQYVFYSNLMNDFSDEQLATLARDWDVIFVERQGDIFVRILSKR